MERQAWSELARVAGVPFVQEIGLQTTPIGAAFFFMASRLPQMQFNWLSGTGLNGDDGGSIATAAARFRQAGQRNFAIQIPPGPRAHDCREQASLAGLKEHSLAWVKFYRSTANAPSIHTSLKIRQIAVEERALFGETAAAGFGMPPSFAPWLAGVVGEPNWYAYVSFAGDEPVGAAAMYVQGDFAWLGIGATKPHSRNMGSQSALLARRLADAAAYGARHATVETGRPIADQPAPSYSNILKAGFTIAYVRPNWAEPHP